MPEISSACLSPGIRSRVLRTRRTGSAGEGWCCTASPFMANRQSQEADTQVNVSLFGHERQTCPAAASHCLWREKKGVVTFARNVARVLSCELFYRSTNWRPRGSPSTRRHGKRSAGEPKGDEVHCNGDSMERREFSLLWVAARKASLSEPEPFKLSDGYVYKRSMLTYL